jgi:hypothetical protein
MSYSPEVLDKVCPVCKAAVTAKCLDRLPNGMKRWREDPHQERIALAYGYNWYCCDCDRMVAREHLVAVYDRAAQSGTCKPATVMEAAA